MIRLAASIVGDAVGEPTEPDPDEGKAPPRSLSAVGWPERW